MPQNYLPDVRRRHILESVVQSGMVRVAELASKLNVAEETVRRDLEHLDRQGLLIRTHGGAVAPNSSAQPDTPFEQRRQAMLPQKRAIAREAFKRIGRASTIALDGSTTAWELATLLTDPNLTVVTNSLIITVLLASKPGPQVIAVGGTLDRKLQMFTGLIAIDD